MIMSVPLLAWSAACFALARVFVVRRAFVPARNPLLRFFKALDARLSSLNERFARGVILLRDSTLLPEDEPIAWRETAKKSLGTVRYLIRVFLALEVPTAAICLLVVIFSVDSSSRLEEVSVLLFFIWIIAALLLSVASTSLIAGERSHQTLDVLLATPLSGREIVLQKMRGARRLMAVLLVPFFTVFLLQSTWKGILHGSSYGGMQFSMLVYLTCSALSVLVYLPLISWLSLLIGLRMRSQSRAIIVAVAVLAGWCLVPYIVPMVQEILSRPGRIEGGMAYFLLVSPMTIIPVNEFYEYRPFGSALAPVAINFAMHGAILYGLRAQVLANADRWLGRNPGA